ncbi:MAG: cytochrome c-type biogenesis protein CcmH [Natronospirillum sp.]|uniref:cytochrome c-type biogenesis protein n=1 Tax=Natronospirillum sp. TaxID=2812955 RepID=UPI0025E17693|nr:cytochrome c-type biogenesis protein [Natronospirillum sp.]MCH8551386.1 cytochrome c-type biogenesis protein CcmH [Natronospirillum sp.]
MRWLLLFVLVLQSPWLMAQTIGEGTGLLTPDDQTLVEPLRQFSSSDLEERFHRLNWTLRCMQCDNQAIGDSNAPVSAQMRDRVARLLEDGYSDREIVDFMIERYGEGVTYRPRLGGHTIWIWVAGFALTAFLVAVILGIRKRHSGPSDDPGDTKLTAEEQARLRALRERSRGESA